MTTTPDLKSQSPVEIDTVLSDLWNQIFEQRFRAYQAMDAIDQYTSRRYASMDISSSVRYYEERLAEAQAELARLTAETEPYEAEYVRRGRWNRYYLVTNTNGHVHRGMDCSTCYPRTAYRWLIELADCDEAKMVEEWGEDACTVCFPDAPADPNFNRPSKRTQAERDAKAAEKAARAAKKAEKNLLEPVKIYNYSAPERTIRMRDGSERVSPAHDVFEKVETVAAAKTALKSQFGRLSGYYSTNASEREVTHFEENARILAEALRAKGFDVDALVSRIRKSVAKECGKFHEIEGASK